MRSWTSVAFSQVGWNTMFFLSINAPSFAICASVSSRLALFFGNLVKKSLVLWVHVIFSTNTVRKRRPLRSFSFLALIKRLSVLRVCWLWWTADEELNVSGFWSSWLKYNVLSFNKCTKFCSLRECELPTGFFFGNLVKKLLVFWVHVIFSTDIERKRRPLRPFSFLALIKRLSVLRICWLRSWTSVAFSHVGWDSVSFLNKRSKCCSLRVNELQTAYQFWWAGSNSSNGLYFLAHILLTNLRTALKAPQVFVPLSVTQQVWFL